MMIAEKWAKLLNLLFSTRYAFFFVVGGGGMVQ
jgi:hypothetical protein